MSTSKPISRQQLEDQFRVVQNDLVKKVESKKQPALAAGAVGGVLLLIIVYFLGRRGGRKRSALVQIKRI